ncbi:hypothetical protein AAFF_G00431610 [Aldrovandia affinis]|uniref:Uncharacterized protein n=1 Tax=Aldrovandia affinis TaxID=143900 RepID=A0AAD7WJ96_9TELE|nr:hypothetical protein AAFF_G00431610 [Aldrovandia affinis]
MAHVPCLLPKPALGCWYRKYSEDEDELLPLYHGCVRLKPKTEGSLRRRLLSAKIHQKQDSLWTLKPLAAPPLPCPNCLLSCYHPSCTPMQPYPDWTVLPHTVTLGFLKLLSTQSTAGVTLTLMRFRRFPYQPSCSTGAQTC